MMTMKGMFASALLLLASISPISSQLATGYDTAPFYVQTFDTQPTPQQLDASKGGFTWSREVSGRQGVAFLDRVARNYIDVNSLQGKYVTSFIYQSTSTWLSSVQSSDAYIMNRMLSCEMPYST